MKETHQGFLSRSITHRSGSFAGGKTSPSKSAIGVNDPLFSHKPNRKPEERFRFGKEEQRYARALTFIKKSEHAICSLLRRGRSKHYRCHQLQACSDVQRSTKVNISGSNSVKWFPSFFLDQRLIPIPCRLSTQLRYLMED